MLRAPLCRAAAGVEREKRSPEAVETKSRFASGAMNAKPAAMRAMFLPHASVWVARHVGPSLVEVFAFGLRPIVRGIFH